jgi:RND family efflux transporter MFP subunit
MSDPLSADLASLRIQRDEGPRSRSPWRLLIFLVALTAGVSLAYATLAPRLEARLFKTEVTVTEVTLVSPSQGTVDLTATGYVIPQRIARIGSKVVGRVLRVGVREGDSVKTGQVLFELDPSDPRSAIAANHAKVASARARAEAAQATLAEIRIQWERHERLARSGAAPQATADDFAARVRVLNAQVTSAVAEVRAQQAEGAALAVSLANFTILAPLDGTATSKPVEVGDVVGPSAPLVEIADFDALLVEVDVPEARLGLVRPKAPCELVLDSAPDRRLRGEVVDLGPRLNRAKASGLVKVRFIDRPERLRPEMSVRVSFLQQPLDPSSLAEAAKRVVPSAAVVTRSGTSVVFVIDQGRVRMVPVALGAEVGSGYELREGPPAATRVVRDPPATLADGLAIKERP